jgi:hypothetical protein
MTTDSQQYSIREWRVTVIMSGKTHLVLIWNILYADDSAPMQEWRWQILCRRRSFLLRLVMTATKRAWTTKHLSSAFRRQWTPQPTCNKIPLTDERPWRQRMLLALFLLHLVFVELITHQARYSHQHTHQKNTFSEIYGACGITCFPEHWGGHLCTMLLLGLRRLK